MYALSCDGARYVHVDAHMGRRSRLQAVVDVDVDADISFSLTIMHEIFDLSRPLFPFKCASHRIVYTIDRAIVACIGISMIAQVCLQGKNHSMSHACRTRLKQERGVVTPIPSTIVPQTPTSNRSTETNQPKTMKANQILARLGAIVLLNFFFSSVSSGTGSPPRLLNLSKNSTPNAYPVW